MRDLRNRFPLTGRELTERVFGLTLLGFSVEAVADYLNVPIAVVKAERSRCRALAHDLIADVLSVEVCRG